MHIRSTQTSVFNQVRSGLRINFGSLARAQEQVATGKRILRPSDDAVGAALALALRRRIDEAGRYLAAIDAGRPLLERGAAGLEQASGLIAEARAVVIEGLNGTLSAADRRTLATRIERLRAELVGVANARTANTYVFGGTLTQDPPFVEQTVSGARAVVYRGDDGLRSILVGSQDELAVNVPGSEVFGKREPSGVSIDGVTGAAPGTTANQGSGFASLHVRHDATVGALGSGLAFVSGGALDTLLGDRTLVVDAAAGTVQLGSGPARDIPQPGAPDLADFAVEDEHGALLHLDFSAYTGASFSGTVSGQGSIALEGSGFAVLDFLDTDLELVDAASGNVLHVDTTGIRRAGVDLVTYGGAPDVFAVLQGIADDLRNDAGLGVDEVSARLAARLAELDRHGENVLAGLGTLGARLERLDGTETRLQDVGLHLEGLRSNVEDADLASVVLDLSKADQTLQLAQATGARLIQNTLLSFLR
jgi:flagellar hook-associated protein 3 FlgL